MFSSGSPSWLIVGAPSSRVQLVTKFSRSAGDQLRPAPIFVSVPKSESWSISALAFSVKLPSALKSRPRREIGRSRLTAALPAVRPANWRCHAAARGARVSRSRCSRRRGSVAPALPAGTLNKVPFAVRGNVPEVRGLARAVAREADDRRGPCR